MHPPLLSFLAFSLCHFDPLPCLFSHSFSFQIVVNVCRHRVHTKHQSLNFVDLCQFVDEPSCLTKPHRPPCAALYPPPRSESCEGKSTLGWMFEVKENLKNERDYKQANRPLAVIPTGLYLAVTVFSVMHLQYVDTHVTFTIKKQKRTHAPIHTLAHAHVYQLMFLTLMPSTLSLSLSHTHTRTTQG